MAKTETARTLTQIMADFVYTLDFHSIPENVVVAARRQLADSMASALGAYDTAAVRTVRDYAAAKGGRRDATILGTKRKVPAEAAALVNGTMVRYLDANDILVSSRGGPSGHCSDATPGLVAVAEKYGRNGEELLTCLVACYELQGALAESFDFWERGLHVLTNLGWVSAIPTARLAGATPLQAVHASGLAVATDSVINTWLRPSATIPMIKGIAVGAVMERAVEAAELAKNGMTATEDALEHTLSRLSPSGDPEAVRARFEQLGRRWTTTLNMTKAYPAQLYTQPAIQAVLELYQNGIRATHVRKLILYGHRHVCAGVQGSQSAFAPASREAADHSTPYVMAMALLRGRLTSKEYENAPWTAAEVKSVMGKIQLVEDTERNRSFDAGGVLGVRLVAELSDGSFREVIIHQPKGHPDAPLTEAELLQKMTWLLDGIAPAHAPARILELCSGLSTADDVANLIAACNVVPQRSEPSN
jgi:2-methylcitrate dehydratase